MASAIDKRTEDLLAEQAAVVTQRCAPDGPQSLAVVMHRHKSQPSRWMKGDRSGPAFRAFEFVVCTSRGQTTTPYPFLTQLKLVAMREHLEERDSHWLIKRWHELQTAEVHAEAREKRASQAGDRATYRQALIDEAAIQLELAAIDEVLERRGIDPRDCLGHQQ